MFLRPPETHSRSVVKAVSWRILGSIDTFAISFLVTGELVFAASIASVETFTKLALYYVHERAWARVPWGRAERAGAVANGEPPAAGPGPSPERVAAEVALT
ncbi:MAG: DUF2061 domain-containing protein [Alphaproteobacteria bacterium]|nr:DUF2061 domain-containing protein [Alphaproteobacteria bacterium]